MKVVLDTLGCKLNQAETELLARQFVEAGYSVVSSVDEADVYILNTCTVTHVADSKSRHLLRMAHRRNPAALVVATGCYAQRVPHELAGVGEVGLVVGNGEKLNLVRRLEESGYYGRPGTPCQDSATGYNSLSRTRAFVKVQDGCNNFCAYCIVPLVRGGEKNQPVEQVVAEVRQRVAGGYQEIVLTGTEIGSYRNNGVNLKGLLERLLAEDGVSRLRLSSLQPQEISPGLIELWRDTRLCPHFHLSLQSGSDGVLSRMGRHYCVSDYQKALDLIRGMVPDVAITTDVIVGFPGETEDEFEESYELCRQSGFARIHVFPYSLRPGTEAARLPGKVDERAKRERSQRMLALARESEQSFRRRFAGRVMPVLWEQKSGIGVWSGLTGNYIKVYTESDEDLSNRLLPARVG